MADGGLEIREVMSYIGDESRYIAKGRFISFQAIVEHYNNSKIEDIREIFMRLAACDENKPISSIKMEVDQVVTKMTSALAKDDFDEARAVLEKFVQNIPGDKCVVDTFSPACRIAA